jgi:conjugative relaxase-like TrwC/TraI family protein
MLAITPSQSENAAAKYFVGEVGTGDYFTEHGQLPIILHEEGAIGLGVDGRVGTAKEFVAFVRNRHPDTGEKVTARDAANRRPGYDFTFSATKSFSIAYTYARVTGRDEFADKLLELFRESVGETMAKVAEDTRCQVNEPDGRHSTRVTGNMLWAEALHPLARPVDGFADPDTHIHAYVFNMTKDGDRHKAVEFSQFMYDRTYYQAMQYDLLAEKLQAIGLPTELAGFAFEIKGISRETIEKYSRRREQVKEAEKKKDPKTAKAKLALGVQTRAGKDEGVPYEQAMEIFYARLSDDEKITLERLMNNDGGPAPHTEATPEQGIAYATSHEFTRKSAMNEKRFYASAIMHSLGSGLSRKARELAQASTELVFGETKYGEGLVSTREVQQEEAAIRSIVRKASVVPSYAEQREAKGLGPYEIKRPLSGEQKVAFEHCITSTSKIIGIRGWAGTGKSFAMQETSEAMEEATDRKVIMLAPGGRTAFEDLRGDGFDEADTLAKFLRDREMQKAAKGNIVWLEEAGLVGTKTMRQLLELSETLGFRLVLQGDKFQHGSPERGDALRFIEERCGLEFAELSEIRRQIDPDYRDAVKTVAKGNIGEGFDKLDAMGWISEVADRDDRHTQIAKAYLDTIDQAPKNVPRQKLALIVAPTHEEGDAVNSRVREEMRARGKLTDERSLSRLKATSWTEAQKQALSSYKRTADRDLVVEFVQNADGFTKGERFYVRGIVGGEVMISTTKQGEGGVVKALPRDLADRFQVYEERSFALAVGDVVRISAGGKDAAGKRLNTGSTYEVVGFDVDGGVLLGTEPGKISRKLDGNRALHLAHGYVTTSHASQGATVQHVFVAQGAEGFAAASREQFYVSISRGKKSVRVFTDDKDALRHAIERSGARMFASDVVDRGIAAKLPKAPAKASVLPAPAAMMQHPALAKTQAWWRPYFDAAVNMVMKVAAKRREAYALAADAVPSTLVNAPEISRLTKPWTARVQPPKEKDEGYER